MNNLKQGSTHKLKSNLVEKIYDMLHNYNYSIADWWKLHSQKKSI